MSNMISLTIPGDNNAALVAGATMLLTLAGKVPAMELEDTKTLAEHVHVDTPPADDTTAAGAATTTTPPPAGDDAGAATTATTETAATTTTPPPADVVLDKHGLPWDARIHTGTKALLADGAWRYKQGVDRVTLVPQVEAELRTLMANNAPAATTTTPPPVDTTAAGTTTTTPPPADADAPSTFPEFLKAVSGLISTQKTTMVAVNEVLNRPEFGVASIQLVNSVPAKIPAIWAALVASCE